jgi:hypothetical protein
MVMATRVFVFIEGSSKHARVISSRVNKSPFYPKPGVSKALVIMAHAPVEENTLHCRLITLANKGTN